MKKTSVVLVIGMSSLLTMSFTGIADCGTQEETNSCEVLESCDLFREGILMEEEASKLKVEDIVLIEVEEELDLSIHLASNLPKGFNPYQGMDSGKRIQSEFESNNPIEDDWMDASNFKHLFEEGQELEKQLASLRVEDLVIVEEDLEI